MNLLPWSLLVGASLALGCGDRSPPGKPAAANQVAAVVESPAPTVDAGVTTLPAYDPASGYHLDPDVGDAPRPPGRTGPRDRKVIQLLLRSTPGGAMAAVDGVQLGTTPVLWEGVANGTPREFTFVLAGHALARYQFVPITDGIVHGTLARIPDDKLLPAVPAPIAPPPWHTAPHAVLPPPPAPVPAMDAAAPSAPGPAVDGGPPPTP